MKKKIAKCIGILIFISLVIVAIFNIYNWINCGNQYIRINTSTKAYANSDLYVSIIAQKNEVDVDTTTKLKLLNSKGKKVKDVKITYEGSNAVLSIPNIEAGNYFLEANVSSKAGKDTIQKEIYISNENKENVTITLEKGIYKPGDIVNYRALLTNKEYDYPLSKDINVSIYDGNDNKVYNENIKSSEYGIISGSFTLANEVNSGLYKIVVKTDSGETIKQFKVNPYVTPKYEVKISYDKENYLVGDKAKININAKYFFREEVKNAEFKVYIDEKEYETVKSDTQGNAIIEYEIKEAKKYNIKVEAVDSSNYFVEEKSDFTAGTDIFEVQLLSEYGSLIAEKKNNVYVFTNRADGTPVKAYITISSDNYTKQIVTDENGIGKFTIDIDGNTKNYYEDYKSTLKSEKNFLISAEDTTGNKVRKNLTLDIEQKELLLSTDKVKYNQGEDIEINVESMTENAKNVYFFKGDKLIKMLSTDLGETSVNLGDTYGLIDIYITEKLGGNEDYYYILDKTNNYKKTIFIKPTKKLNINIVTDKEEYKPKDNITISFNTVDENNIGVDSALLVSMLDNSILKLANNDLSIDNIKIALQDIKFSNDLDGATLYSCIVNDTSEQTIMALLLKQSNKDINVSETGLYNNEQKEKSAVISIISIAIILITVTILFSVKFRKTRKAIKHIVNFIIFEFLLVITGLCIKEEFFWKYNYSWLIFAITTIIALIIYISLVSKINEKIFKTSISIIISSLLLMLMLFLINKLEISFVIIILIISIALLICIILAKISEVRNLKINKYMNIIFKEIVYILKFLAALIISLIVGAFIEGIIVITGISIPITLVALYLFNYLFNKTNKEDISENTKHKTTVFYIIIVLAVIGIMAIGYIIISILNSGTNGILSADRSTISNMENIGPITSTGIADSAISVDSASSSNGISSIFDEVGDMFATNKNETTKQDEITSNTEKVETTTDDNVRNVFLESMCFIPELLSTNGNASINLKLSDNITSWTIQTIGNTKYGRIGYGILNNIKVFKEFFVDFDLPKNLVETDKVSIPVTVYNYTDKAINTTLKIKEEEWFSLEKNNINVKVEAKSSKMVYVPISVLKKGNNKFRVEVSNDSLTDMVEKECIVTPKGYKIEKIVSTGNLSEDISEDILILDNIIDNTGKVKVKIYSSTISQTIEGMENIFKMPTGCFEQISSSLYPNILALKYLEDNGIINEEIKTKATSYISSGYQKLLTYEVKGESGGYSLYGDSPAETVLTAYGLMEISDLREVYNVDDNVIKNMTEFLYKKQNLNGTFKITGNHIGGATSREELALNAYITWALSESNPTDERLNKSIEYLKDKLEDIDDNYTLALVANILANVKDKELNNVLKRLASNVNLDENNAYIKSNIIDYYGSRDNLQTVQTVALTSIAFSKTSYNPDLNKRLLNYLISKKDARGTWHNTQATILALKALNEKNEKSKLENQTITVKLNSEEQKIEIKDNPLELYELTFENINKENKLNIDIEKGNACYEVVEEYYIPYENV